MNYLNTNGVYNKHILVKTLFKIQVIRLIRIFKTSDFTYINFFQGCALSGSTQSGKAETVKGFASILGKYLYTLNGGKSFDQCALVNALKVE